MFATSYRTMAVKLELNDTEARWLKNLMQNPLDSVTLNAHEVDINPESNLNKTMRHSFFTALQEAGVE